jgi:hypothetical protein
VLGEPALTSAAGLGLEAVDEVDHIVEAAAGAAADAASCDGYGKMGLAGSSTADQDDVALLSDEAAAGEIAHKILIDRRILEREVVDVFGKRQLGDRELVFDRTRVLLGYLGFEQIADKVLRLVLALDRCCEGLVIGAFIP